MALAAVAAVFLRGWGGSAAGTVGTVAEGVAQDAEASLEVLLAAGDGESPELAFNDDGSLGFAQGTLSTHSVADDEDALMVLDDLKGLLNLQNVDGELAFDARGSVGDTSIYRFHQCYEGIPVLGKVAILGVDGAGTPCTLVADTVVAGTPPTEATVGTEEAFAAAEKACSNEVVSCRGLAYLPVESGVELVWVVVCEQKLCFVSATTGEVLAQQPAAWTMEGIDGVHEEGQKVSFSVEEHEGSYQLIDRERNITYHDAQSMSIKARSDFKDDAGETLYRYDESSGKVVNVRDGSEYGYDEFIEKTTEGECLLCRYENTGQHLIEEAAFYAKRLPDGIPVYEDSDNVWIDERALDVVAQLNQAYDFYDRRGWRGLYGHNHPMHVYLYDYIGGDVTNAGMSVLGALSVGTSCDVSQGTIKHEYTHAVLNGIARLSLVGEESPETNALHEAYADVMAVIIDRNERWLSGSGSRNLRDPSQSSNDEQLSYYDPHGLRKEAHLDSTIVSHTAYLMYENGLTWEEMADLWYGSIWLLPPDADFNDCRRGILATAYTLGLSEEKRQAVWDAFDAVGIFEETSIALAPDALIVAYDVGGGPHRGLEVRLEQSSLVQTGLDDLPASSLTTSGNTVSLSDLQEITYSGVLPVTYEMKQLTLTVADASGSGELHQWSVVLSEQGQSQLEVYFDTPGSETEAPSYEEAPVPVSDDGGDSDASLDISDAEADIENQSGRAVAYVEQLDFDGDGAQEAFVIVGEPVDDVADAWSGAELWFASQTGEVSRVAGSETFDHVLRYIDTFADGSSPHAFLSVENTAFGSGAICHVYTVHDGVPAEVAFDQEGVMWVRGENGMAKGTISVWGGSHQHQDYLFSYSEQDNTFYTAEEIGALY